MPEHDNRIGQSEPFSVMAFDFGTKQIGVAVGSGGAASAKELNCISAKDGIPDWHALEQLFSEWQPKQILVGLPVNMDDSESEMTRRARKFGRRIEGRFALTVQFIDERLTTREAKEIAHQRGKLGDYSKNPVDAIAARLILETWFNEQRRAP